MESHPDQQHDELYRIRHSLAHVLAQAVLEFRPKAKLAFGPPVDNGCYYDFLFDTPLSPDDFPAIEKSMRRIIGERQPFIASSRSSAEAIAHLKASDQHFKAEYCEELSSNGEQTIGFFTNGSFEDMCAGPHVEHTGKIPPDAFKLDSIAGAYWRGNEKNPQLTRIYCLAFKNKQDLNAYIENRKLALERDHRKLGKELELFIISDKVGAGLPLWTPNGTAIRESLETFAKETEARAGYVRVATPHLAKADLYEQSGHLEMYRDSMFPPMELEGESAYYLKPMNCPHHHQIFSHRPRSYRELPLRFAEYGTVYRYEASGTLSGLLRVRSIAQNDAHIYCTLDQMKSELMATFQMCLGYYEKFRFQKVKVRFSTHDPANSAKFHPDPELWAFSEKVVKEVVEEAGVEYFEGKGEAAFYGPKIDFQATSVVGREESISTTQLDFAQPIRFDLGYIGEDGQRHRPYIVHRAPLGAHERFIAFLIEHFGGAFPTWMAPIQVRVIPVKPSAAAAADALCQQLREDLVRVEVDHSDNSFNKKIREAVTHKIPNMVIIGDREAAEGTVTLRRYCTEAQVTIPVGAFVDRIRRCVSQRIMDNFADVTVS
jgi:threonyl-tRNA synthetase